jgi:uridine kinase
MNTETPPELIALVGGSGAGKSWLADRLRLEFGNEATSLSLDDFYFDLAYLEVSEREKVNFDNPDAIDWTLFGGVLRELKRGATALVPHYDFATHTRSTSSEWHSPRPFIFVEGLWLLWHAEVRELFDLRVFLDCVQSLRWERRATRDLSERGRTMSSIREQFWNFVAPMHERFVEPQKAWADLVIERSITQTEFGRLTTKVRALRAKAAPPPSQNNNSPTTTPPVAALQTL